MARSIEEVINRKAKKELVSLKHSIVKLIEDHIRDCERDINKEMEKMDDLLRDRPR